jgi:kynurenine formamidase
MRVLDLSWPINDGLPVWLGDRNAFQVQVEHSIAIHGYFDRSFSISEHYGTHLDAPAHFISDGCTVEQIPAERLLGAAVLIDMRDEVARDADYTLTPEDVAKWEARHGEIPTGAIVLLYTGWAERWKDAGLYMNADAAGRMHFPGFGHEAARCLIDRGVKGIGADTPSVDAGRALDCPVHHVALSAGLYQLENLADLSDVPDIGAFLLVAPMKLAGASGAPCRVFALLP